MQKIPLKLAFRSSNSSFGSISESYTPQQSQSHATDDHDHDNDELYTLRPESSIELTQHGESIGMGSDNSSNGVGIAMASLSSSKVSGGGNIRKSSSIDHEEDDIDQKTPRILGCTTNGREIFVTECGKVPKRIRRNYIPFVSMEDAQKGSYDHNLGISSK